MLYVDVDPSRADNWKLESVIDLLKRGAVGVIPTDVKYVSVGMFFSFSYAITPSVQ